MSRPGWIFLALPAYDVVRCHQSTEGRSMAKKKRPQEGAQLEGTGLVEQLRAAIRNSGESLNQLGQRAGIGRDRLSRFMRGERDLTLEAAEKIATALGLHLAGGEGASASAKPARPEKKHEPD